MRSSKLTYALRMACFIREPEPRMFSVRSWRRTFKKFSSSPNQGVEQPGFQSSVSRHGVELLGNLVRALRLASNFLVQNESAERKFDCFG